ncbi:MAG: phosphoribosylglycinamide formyltransferase [Sedimentisphaerales bacterium]|nr:phosphoribosylglycinamide formyltransferase [Sedimentisphaerales bacterium]
MSQTFTIYTDGGSRGNPGPGAGAFIIFDSRQNQLCAEAKFLPDTTNNIAEYTGLAEGLAKAKALGAEKVKIFSDSELMVKQINGEYKVKSENIRQLFNKCTDLLKDFSSWEITHIRRDKNKLADKLVNRAIDISDDIKEIPIQDDTNSRHLRLGILISGSGRTMINILELIKQKQLNAEIAIVISSRSQTVGVEKAKKAGLPLEIIRKKDFDDIDNFSKKLHKTLFDAKVDLIIQAGWLCLWKIPPEYENLVMNIHPALLPSFGGKGMWGHHVHEAVLSAGCKISGCTVHFCTNEYDKGPIILQRCCQVLEGDDADTLAGRVFEQECIAYPEAIRLFSQGRIVVKDDKTFIK